MEISIGLQINFSHTIFYNTSCLNIYTATSPNQMHHLDLGLFKYQIMYTREHLKTIYEQATINDFDIQK